MNITLADERAFHLLPQYSPGEAQVEVETKKTSLVAGRVGSLLRRPDPDDIQLTYSEHRLEPFWNISIHLFMRYDRNSTYTVKVSGSEVRGVTLLENKLQVDPHAKGGPEFVLQAIEHCERDRRATQTFDGAGKKADLAKYLTGFRSVEIEDMESFGPDGVLVAAPEARASAVVRRVMGELIAPAEAQVIHEENVDVEQIDLYFRPVYAFEYEWAAKDKRVVIEFDALTGKINTGGKTLRQHMRGMITRDLVFDVSAEAVGLIVPGGGIAVKLVQAVVDRGKK